MKKTQQVDTMYEFLRVILGMIIAFILCLVIIVLLTGKDGAKDAIFNFMIGPFTSKRRFSQVLSRMCPYLMCGCGMCFVYASGRFSVISEGIMNIAPTMVFMLMFNSSFGLNIMPGLPRIVNQIIIVTLCAISGGLVALIPAFGREKLGADETVTSTILNMICVYIPTMIIRDTIANRDSSYITTPIYPDNMRFARYWHNTNLSEGVWYAIFFFIVALIVFYRTRVGTEIRITGSNPSFAKYVGINIAITPLLGQVIGGIFAGIGSSIENFGAYDSFMMTQLTNIGYDGLIIAVMARKQPIFVPFTAFFLAYLRTAAAVLNTNTNIPIELVTMLQAVIVFFVAAEGFLSKQRQKSIIKISEQEAKKEA